MAMPSWNNFGSYQEEFISNYVVISAYSDMPESGDEQHGAWETKDQAEAFAESMPSRCWVVRVPAYRYNVITGRV